MESRHTCTVPEGKWHSDKSSKDELARDFNQIYAKDLAGKISAASYPSSEERMQRLTTKVFGSKLLAHLAKQDDFEILAVGRKYFNALEDIRYFSNGSTLSLSSRMQTFVVRDKQSGVVFFVDAGGLHPTYLFCSDVEKPLSTDDRLLPEHKIYNSQTCMPFIPLKAKSESEQVNLVIWPEEAKKSLVINIEACLAPSHLLQDSADTKTKKCPSDHQVSETATKLSNVVEAAFKDAKDHIKNTKIDGLRLNDKQLDYYQEALKNGTLGRLSSSVHPALLRAKLEERAIKQGEIINIESDFSTLNEESKYVSAFPGRESILLNPKSEILNTLYQEFVQKAAASKDISEIQPILTTIINQNLTSENLDNDLIESDKIVDIEKFIEKHQGVCRHKAFLAAYFLGRLVKEAHLSTGKVTHYRSYSQDLRSHTLVIYTPSQAPTKHYLIDCAQNLYFTISDQESFNQASAAYRDKSLTGILHRFAVQHHFQLPQQELTLPLSNNVINKLEEEMNRDENFEERLLQNDLICPITQLPLRDPVKIGNDGKHAFERSALTAWLAKHNTCPVTRKPAGINSIVPDRERKTRLLDIVANELKGIQPEEANGEILADQTELKNQALKCKRVQDLGLVGYYLRSTLADENKRKFTLEGASALGRIEGKLFLKQKELRSTNSMSDAEYNKQLTDILHSEDKAIKNDLYAVEILANIGLALLGAVIFYGIAQGVYYACKGTFFIAQQTREEEKILNEVEKNYFVPTVGV